MQVCPCRYAHAGMPMQVCPCRYVHAGMPMQVCPCRYVHAGMSMFIYIFTREKLFKISSLFCMEWIIWYYHKISEIIAPFESDHLLQRFVIYFDSIYPLEPLWCKFSYKMWRREISMVTFSHWLKLKNDFTGFSKYVVYIMYSSSFFIQLLLTFSCRGLAQKFSQTTVILEKESDRPTSEGWCSWKHASYVLVFVCRWYQSISRNNLKRRRACARIGHWCTPALVKQVVTTISRPNVRKIRQY